MRKLFLLVAAALFGVAAQAQIVSSRSVSINSEPSETVWLTRVGINFMNMAGSGAEGLDGKVGYNFNVEFNKPIGGLGAYWGMNLGLGSRGFKTDYLKSVAHNVQYSPFTFGWKIGVADNIRIDPHVGVYASYDFSSKMKENGESISWGDYADYLEVDYHGYDVGLNAGIGVWYDRYNLDLCYQRGFVDAFSDFDGLKTSNFMIRLGIAF